MASVFATQLQPFEENQSPSPNETENNPYESSLARASTHRSRSSSNGLSSPINTVNSLHRQLSGDPESPPPPWQRRTPSQSHHARSPSSTSGHARTPGRSPSESPSTRRHHPPGLTMTATQVAPPPMPGMFLHESPSGSSTSLVNGDLTLPNPAFRRRAGGGGSNRSSVASSADLGNLTGEELWALGQEQDIPDMSNPMRYAAERPLDTVRRESGRIDRGVNYRPGLPGEVIWPTASGADDFAPPVKSKSSASLAMLGKKTSDRRLSRRAKSRQASMESQISPPNNAIAKSTPTSPIVTKSHQPGGLQSAHSSSTSLASQNLPPNKSFGNLSRPPSAYYSRDFLSSLAPREGGYAIAATMGNGLGAVGTMTVEDRRRSGVFDDGRSRSAGSRAPLSKSAGMGRWSLDGGENFNRPYTTPSAATTSSNLSAPPLQPESSPPLDDSPSALPLGAAGPMLPGTSSASTSTALTPASSNPTAPSPLGQNSDSPVTTKPATIPPPPPIPQGVPPPQLNEKKSKKQLRKENKDAEKAEAVRVARERAEAARAATLKKQQQKEAEDKAKEDAKRKAKEDKARLKAEKKAAKGSFFGRKQSSAPPPSGTPTPKSSVLAQPREGPAPQTSVKLNDSASTPSSAAPGSQPFPNVASSQSAYKVPMNAAEAPRPTHRSMPLDRGGPAPPKASPAPAQQPASAVRPGIQNKRSLFGTIRKRFSVMGGDDMPPVPNVPAVPVPSRTAPQAPSTPASTAAQAPALSSSSATPRTESLKTGSADEPALIPAAGPSVLPPLDLSVNANTVDQGSEQSATPRNIPAASLQRSSSIEAPIAAPLGPVLTKSVSHGAVSAISSASPSSSIRRNRTSLIGPRPMPDGRSRAASASTSEHSHASHTSPSHPSGYFSHQTQTAPQPNFTASPAPLSQSQPNSTLSAIALPVTPSTSGESSQYSQLSNVTPITSSSDFDAESGSRKPSLSSEAHDTGMEKSQGEKAREGSKGSNETVHVSKSVLA